MMIEQRHRLADERERRRQPLVEPVDHEGKQHAADHRHRRQQRHRDRRLLAPDHRIQKRDQVDDEADLREQHQRERDRHREEADIAKRPRADLRRRRRIRGRDRRPRSHEPAAARRTAGSPEPSARPSRRPRRSSPPEKPKWPIAATSSGTPTMPPKLAPFSARLIAMPRFLSNQRPSVLVIMPRLVPAQPNASTALAR